MSNMCLCYCLACFASIMGDFACRPLMMQVGPVRETVSPSAATPSAGEGGQPAGEVGPVVVVVEVTLVLLPLSWQRRRGMIVLGHLATRSRRPLESLCPEVGCRVDAHCGSPFNCVRCPFGSIGSRGSYCCCCDSCYSCFFTFTCCYCCSRGYFFCC